MKQISDEPYGTRPAPAATGDGLFDDALQSLHAPDPYADDEDDADFVTTGNKTEDAYATTDDEMGTPPEAAHGQTGHYSPLVPIEIRHTTAQSEAPAPLPDTTGNADNPNASQVARLAELEAQITQNVGRIEDALRIIKEDGLYKAAGYKRFEQYVDARWRGLGIEMSQSRMRQLAASGTTRETLKRVTSGNKTLSDFVTRMPERQVRELVTVPEAQLLPILETAAQIVEAKPAPVGEAARYGTTPRMAAADLKAAKEVHGLTKPVDAVKQVDAFFGASGADSAQAEASEDEDDEPQMIAYEPHKRIGYVRWEPDARRLCFQVITPFQNFGAYITEQQLIDCGLLTAEGGERGELPDNA